MSSELALMIEFSYIPTAQASPQRKWLFCWRWSPQLQVISIFPIIFLMEAFQPFCLVLSWCKLRDACAPKFGSFPKIHPNLGLQASLRGYSLSIDWACSLINPSSHKDILSCRLNIRGLASLWQCCSFKPLNSCSTRSCRAKVKTTGDGKILHRRGSHNHEAMPALIQVQNSRNQSQYQLQACLSWSRCGSWRPRSWKRLWEIQNLPQPKTSWFQSQKRSSTLKWLHLLHHIRQLRWGFDGDWKSWTYSLPKSTIEI